MEKQHWIFISPHFDDVAFSCGGLVWDLTQKGNTVEVWTIMAGFPPDEDYSGYAQKMHSDWGVSGKEAVRIRRKEDRSACEVLGAQSRHFDWPDVIYRRNPETGRAVVNSDDDLFGLSPEQALVDEIGRMLGDGVPEEALLVLPMGLGNHVDHQAVSQAGINNLTVDYYYVDYPYVLENFDAPIFTLGKVMKKYHRLTENSLRAWQEAVLCYASQRSIFWRDDVEVCLALRNYAAGGGGRVWQTL